MQIETIRATSHSAAQVYWYTASTIFWCIDTDLVKLLFVALGVYNSTPEILCEPRASWAPLTRTGGRGRIGPHLNVTHSETAKTALLGIVKEATRQRLEKDMFQKRQRLRSGLSSPRPVVSWRAKALQPSKSQAPGRWSTLVIYGNMLSCAVLSRRKRTVILNPESCVLVISSVRSVEARSLWHLNPVALGTWAPEQCTPRTC